MSTSLKMWSIEDQDVHIGPLTSYGLALWGLQGLLNPNDIIVEHGKGRLLAGQITAMKAFFRNNGHFRRAKMWAVAGGKGGVGKSVLVAMMGIALAGLNKRVIIVDADFGGANQHSIFSLPIRQPSYWHLLKQNRRLESAALATRFRNLRVIPGPLNGNDFEQASFLQRIKFVQALRILDADYVLIDFGPRTGYDDLDYFLTADVNIVVSTQEPTSLENLSKFIKRIIHRRFDTAWFGLEHNHDTTDVDSIDGMPLVRLMIEKLRQKRLPAEEIMKRVLGGSNLRIVFNMVTDSDFLKDAHMLNKYLKNEIGFTPLIVGGMRHEPLLREALLRKNLTMLTSYSNRAFQDVLEITQKLLVARERPMGNLMIENNQRKSFPQNTLFCGNWCSGWGDCAFQAPGHVCPVRNMN